ncbi:uncharacterized protein LOC122943646 [Bufo gargarizans]|nr:uncharacterized protein LOC122943646 [Bufo gargarizans]
MNQPPSLPVPASPPSKRTRVHLVSDSEEETGYPSDDLEDQIPPSVSEEPRKYLFSSDQLDSLLTAVRQTMAVEEEEPKRSIQDEMFGGLRARKRKIFPVNSYLQDLIKEEWEEGDKKLYIPREFKSRLAFNPEETKLWDEIPKVDIQVAKVVKKTSIPFEDSSQLKDPMDRKMDGLLKKAWESSAATINANISATSVARAMCLWLEQLEEHLKIKTSREEILESLPLLKFAASFMADASELRPK